MLNIPDHPDIARALKTGYPELPVFDRACPRCDGDIKNFAFEIDGVEVCEECFGEWLNELLSTNPDDIAKALNVRYERV